MAIYNFRYRLNQAPQPRNDGSGQVSHDIDAEYRLDGAPTNDPWFVIPSHHQDILIPADVLSVVMAMPHSTTPQKQAKNTAYKQLLVAHRTDQPNPSVTNWTAEQLQEFLDKNDVATLQATNANNYITVTLGLTYPVPFTI